MLAEQIRNNVAVALDTLRANKLRSGLTILGVVMGVSTVMTMAAIVGESKRRSSARSRSRGRRRST